MQYFGITFCPNCYKQLIEKSEREQRVHERCKPNQDELRRLEEIERLIREDDEEEEFKLEMGKNYTIDNGMVVSFDLYMENFDDPVLELVAQFTSLKKLCLAYIGNLPDSFTNLNLLEEIDLSGNMFEEFPKVLTTLKNLKKINMAQNIIDAVPEELFELDLVELDLSYNPVLKNIPESLGNLKNLKVLSLSDTQLTELPESMGNLVNLEKFELLRTNITTLPESLGNLKKLKYLAFPYMDISALRMYSENRTNFNENKK